MTTLYFVNFTKACDYFKMRREVDDLTPAEIEIFVREKIENGDACIGKPEIYVGETLILADNNTRYDVKISED